MGTQDQSASPVAIVTGGARGIGEAIGYRLAADGFRVVVADIDMSAAQRAAAAIASANQSVAMPVKVDVTNRESVIAMVRSVTDAWSRIDALVNNAGILGWAPAADVSESNVLQMLDVHLLGTLRCSQAVLGTIGKSSQASIVNISSINAFTGKPGTVAYSTAKGAIEAMTRVLAVEWAPSGIRVNAVAPGYVDPPPSTLEVRPRRSPKAAVAHRIPMKRWADVSEIAAVVAFLASSKASYVTGAVIPVDGGMRIDGAYDGTEAAK